jgi:hypothetical protein
VRFEVVLGVAVLAAGLAATSTARGEMITASGTWGAGTPTTPISAAGDTWSFSFDVMPPITNGGVTPFTNAAYSLNGVPVTGETISGVTFFPAAVFGLFTLDFSGDDHLDLYGAQVFDARLSLIPGNYPAVVDVNSSTGQLGVGTGSGTVNIAPVPAPPAVVLVGLGAGCVVLKRYVGRRATS